MDSNQKIFAEFFYSAKDTTSNVFISKPLFKSFISALTKLFASIVVTIIALALSIVTRTHPNPIGVFIMIENGLIF